MSEQKTEKKKSKKRLAYEAALTDLEKQLSDAQSLQLLRMLVEAKIDVNLMQQKGAVVMIQFSDIPNELLGRMVRYARECVKKNEEEMIAAMRHNELPPPCDDGTLQII